MLIKPRLSAEIPRSKLIRFVMFSVEFVWLVQAGTRCTSWLWHVVSDCFLVEHYPAIARRWLYVFGAVSHARFPIDRENCVGSSGRFEEEESCSTIQLSFGQEVFPCPPRIDHRSRQEEQQWQEWEQKRGHFCLRSLAAPQNRRHNNP